MRRNRKVLWSLSAIIFSSLILLGSSADANRDLFMDKFLTAKIEVNGNMLKDGDVPAFIVNDRTVIPLRQATEMFDAYVEWDEGRRVIMVTKPVVNMTIININRNRNTIEVNPSLDTGTHSFQVAAQVSKVPISENLKSRFIVVDSNNTPIHTGNSFTINTAKFNGSFNGNLNVANLPLNSQGEYILKLQIEDPNEKNKFISIGEYVISVK
jgi:hypothetical protein